MSGILAALIKWRDRECPGYGGGMAEYSCHVSPVECARTRSRKCASYLAGLPLRRRSHSPRSPDKENRRFHSDLSGDDRLDSSGKMPGGRGAYGRIDH
jgi:hypothetical protein